MRTELATWLGILAFALLCYIFYLLTPTCERGEVMVRGTFGLVCVAGHR